MKVIEPISARLIAIKLIWKHNLNLI